MVTDNYLLDHNLYFRYYSSKHAITMKKRSLRYIKRMSKGNSQVFTGMKNPLRR